MTEHDEAVENRTTGITDVDWLDRTVIEQGDTITTLKAQVSELRSERAASCICRFEDDGETQTRMCDAHRQMQSRAEAAEAKVAKLQDALDRLCHWCEERDVVRDEVARARAALTPDEKEPEE